MSKRNRAQQNRPVQNDDEVKTQDVTVKVPEVEETHLEEGEEQEEDMDRDDDTVGKAADAPPLTPEQARAQLRTALTQTGLSEKLIERTLAALSSKGSKYPRPCGCGCGGTTKGGNYLPGHDAKHMSRILAEERTRLSAAAVVGAGTAPQAPPQVQEKVQEKAPEQRQDVSYPAGKGPQQTDGGQQEA